MLTLNTIKENPEEVIRRLAIKNFDATQVIARVLELDKTRRNTQASLDSSLAELKTLSATIGQLFQPILLPHRPVLSVLSQENHIFLFFFRI